MILPLFPFILLDDPEIVPTDSAPLIMEFPRSEQSQLDGPVRFEICADRVRGTQIKFDGFQGEPTLSVSFDDEATSELAELTAQAVGQKAPISLEGEIVIDPIIQSPLNGGGILITGVRTVAEIERIERAARGRCTEKP